MSRAIILFIILLSIYSPIMAQTPSDWQIIFHNNSDGQVSRIRADGVSTIALPTPVRATGYLDDQHHYLIQSTVTSSMDGRYIAYMDSEFAIHIMDTVTGECCQSVDNPYADNIYPFNRLGLGAVNPDGTAVALSLTIENVQNGDNSNYFGGEVLVIDVDGNMTRSPDFCQPDIGSWLSEGIEVVPICGGGDAYVREHYTLWHPEIGLNGESLDGVDLYGDYLPMTGEHVRLNEDFNYLYTSEAQLHGLANVVTYQASPNSDRKLVYAANEERVLEHPFWVADGHAVILYGYEALDAELIFRDGSYEKLTFDNETHFIAATPDGWVTLDLVTGDLLHYIIGDNHQITVNLLGMLSITNFYSGVVYQPALGASIVATSFDAVPQDLIRHNCFNDLRFRLKIGFTATVVPGPANNVRSEPTTASEIIGQIPSGPEFRILDGPVCAQDMAWWEINYNGLVGWTVEGQGDTYWLSPFKG